MSQDLVEEDEIPGPFWRRNHSQEEQELDEKLRQKEQAISAARRNQKAVSEKKLSERLEKEKQSQNMLRRKHALDIERERSVNVISRTPPLPPSVKSLLQNSNGSNSAVVTHIPVSNKAEIQAIRTKAEEDALLKKVEGATKEHNVKTSYRFNEALKMDRQNQRYEATLNVIDTAVKQNRSSMAHQIASDKNKRLPCLQADKLEENEKRIMTEKTVENVVRNSKEHAIEDLDGYVDTFSKERVEKKSFYLTEKSEKFVDCVPKFIQDNYQYLFGDEQFNYQFGKGGYLNDNLNDMLDTPKVKPAPKQHVGITISGDDLDEVINKLNNMRSEWETHYEQELKEVFDKLSDSKTPAVDKAVETVEQNLSFKDKAVETDPVTIKLPDLPMQSRSIQVDISNNGSVSNEKIEDKKWSHAPRQKREKKNKQQVFPQKINNKPNQFASNSWSSSSHYSIPVDGVKQISVPDNFPVLDCYFTDTQCNYTGMNNNIKDFDQISTSRSQNKNSFLFTDLPSSEKDLMSRKSNAQLSDYLHKILPKYQKILSSQSSLNSAFQAIPLSEPNRTRKVYTNSNLIALEKSQSKPNKQHDRILENTESVQTKVPFSTSRNELGSFIRNFNSVKQSTPSYQPSTENAIQQTSPLMNNNIIKKTATKGVQTESISKLTPESIHFPNMKHSNSEANHPSTASFIPVRHLNNVPQISNKSLTDESSTISSLSDSSIERLKTSDSSGSSCESNDLAAKKVKLMHEAISKHLMDISKSNHSKFFQNNGTRISTPPFAMNPTHESFMYHDLSTIIELDSALINDTQRQSMALNKSQAEIRTDDTNAKKHSPYASLVNKPNGDMSEFSKQIQFLSKDSELKNHCNLSEKSSVATSQDVNFSVCDKKQSPLPSSSHRDQELQFRLCLQPHESTVFQQPTSQQFDSSVVGFLEKEAVSLSKPGNSLKKVSPILNNFAKHDCDSLVPDLSVQKFPTIHRTTDSPMSSFLSMQSISSSELSETNKGLDEELFNNSVSQIETSLSQKHLNEVSPKPMPSALTNSCGDVRRDSGKYPLQPIPSAMNDIKPDSPKGSSLPFQKLSIHYCIEESKEKHGDVACDLFPPVSELDLKNLTLISQTETIDTVPTSVPTNFSDVMIESLPKQYFKSVNLFEAQKGTNGLHRKPINSDTNPVNTITSSSLHPHLSHPTSESNPLQIIMPSSSTCNKENENLDIFSTEKLRKVQTSLLGKDCVFLTGENGLCFPSVEAREIILTLKNLSSHFLSSLSQDKSLSSIVSSTCSSVSLPSKTIRNLINDAKCGSSGSSKTNSVENLSEMFTSPNILFQSTPIKVAIEKEKILEGPGIMDEPDLTLLSNDFNSTVDSAEIEIHENSFTTNTTSHDDTLTPSSQAGPRQSVTSSLSNQATLNEHSKSTTSETESRKSTKHDFKNRTKRLWNNLEEVKQRRLTCENKMKRDENRLKAKEYNKKIQQEQILKKKKGC